MKKYLVLFVALTLFGGACGTSTNHHQNQQTGQPPSNQSTNQDQGQHDNLTVAQQLSNNHCTGTQKTLLTHVPMNPSDVDYILPYGLMVGGHVTPVDHQYYSPAVFNSPINTYPVYAMADSDIVDISTRTHPYQGHDTNITVTDFRIVFSISCKVFYYYDLVTGLAPDIQAAYQQQGRAGVIHVQAGQQIGMIGGQTLDFAVWDMDANLTGFIVPEHYSEIWKIHTVDPLDYETAEVKAATLAKYVRTAEPVSGKIDYDVDGRAIGNWFQVGTHGYAGTVGEGGGDYWVGHLSLSPYFLDPTAFLISIGNWPGGAAQFATKESGPNPADISSSTGLVKFNLVQAEDEFANGQRWDNMSFPKSPIHLGKNSNIEGCFLVQLFASRSLKAETFKGKTCSTVSGFDTKAVMYER